MTGADRNGRSMRPHVVIVGAGFGGLNAALALRKSAVDVTLIDRRNYHLFQPLLYQVATAGLAPSDVASPIRAVVKRHRNIKVLLDRVTGVDLSTRAVLMSQRRLSYDYLVIATGARHSYFGNDAWEPHAPGLKKIEDATEIRRRVLLAFERAETADDEEARKALLTFIVIGGGPTGVEMAGAIAELARKALARDFRNVDPASARVVLLEAGPRLLAAFRPRLSEIARRSLARLGVDVRTGDAVTDCSADGVTLQCGEHIAARTIVWGAGVAASAAAKWLGAAKDKAGRVMVEPDLTLPGHREVFVIGDTASIAQSDGRFVPGLAPAAKQAGRYVADVIASAVADARSTRPFVYRHKGDLATIGRGAAVADFGWMTLSGRLAWFAWGMAHLYFLIGFRNRLAVLLDWLWAYMLFHRGARLITGRTD
jgi:NADH dehydrogenase